MSLLRKVIGMLRPKRNVEEKPLSERDPISVDVSVALQRNEQAGDEARKALEEMRMRDTLAHLAGKMK